MSVEMNHFRKKDYFFGKKSPNYLVRIQTRSIFASAFRKEQHDKTIFDTISYRQVVRRAYSNKSMSKGNTNRQSNKKL